MRIPVFHTEAAKSVKGSGTDPGIVGTLEYGVQTIGQSHLTGTRHGLDGHHAVFSLRIRKSLGHQGIGL